MRTVACGNFILLTSLDKSMICGIISAVSLAERKALRLPPLPRRSADCGIDGFAKMPVGQAFLLHCEISAVSLAERKALRLPPLPRRSADAVLTASQKCRWGKHFCFIVKYPQ